MMQHAPRDGGAEQRYECGSCLNRETASSRPNGCPECGGTLRNISVPRE